MTLNELGKIILKQAEEKGWGHTKEMLDVAQKVMLINTEISEFKEALETNPTNPKDTIEAENADILIRTLHLGCAWGVDFDVDEDLAFRYKGKVLNKITDSDLLYLHSLASSAYENYRHKNEKMFKQTLYIIAKEVVFMTEAVGRDVEESVMNKIKINESRTWDKNKLQGNYFK